MGLRHECLANFSRFLAGTFLANFSTSVHTSRIFKPILADFEADV